MTARELLPEAFDHFTALVHRVPADAWGNATPCSEWTVRELVNHMTSEHLWAPRLLTGETMQEIGEAYDGDVLGADPVAAWDATAPTSKQAWSAVDEQTPVDLTSGTRAAAEYAEEMLLDFVVHAWDLARGAGIEEGSPVPDTVVHTLRFVRERGIPGVGLFGPEVRTDSNDPLEQLVALSGRQP